jgi:hypothetical protein
MTDCSMSEWLLIKPGAHSVYYHAIYSGFCNVRVWSNNETRHFIPEHKLLQQQSHYVRPP